MVGVSPYIGSPRAVVSRLPCCSPRASDDRTLSRITRFRGSFKPSVPAGSPRPTRCPSTARIGEIEIERGYRATESGAESGTRNAVGDPSPIRFLDGGPQPRSSSLRQARTRNWSGSSATRCHAVPQVRRRQLRRRRVHRSARLVLDSRRIGPDEDVRACRDRDRPRAPAPRERENARQR